MYVSLRPAESFGTDVCMYVRSKYVSCSLCDDTYIQAEPQSWQIYRTPRQVIIHQERHQLMELPAKGPLCNSAKVKRVPIEREDGTSRPPS